MELGDRIPRKMVCNFDVSSLVRKSQSTIGLEATLVALEAARRLFLSRHFGEFLRLL